MVTELKVVGAQLETVALFQIGLWAGIHLTPFSAVSVTFRLVSTLRKGQFTQIKNTSMMMASSYVQTFHIVCFI